MTEARGAENRLLPLVCILSAGGEPGLDAAVTSARRFDLSVLIGHSGDSHNVAPPADAEKVTIAWRDDFAAARNELAAIAQTRHASHPFLLWLDATKRSCPGRRRVGARNRHPGCSCKYRTAQR